MIPNHDNTMFLDYIVHWAPYILELLLKAYNLQSHSKALLSLRTELIQNLIKGSWVRFKVGRHLSYLHVYTKGLELEPISEINAF